MGHVTLWEKYTSNCKWLSQNRSTKGNGENLASFILVPSSNYHASLQHVLEVDNKYSLWKLDEFSIKCEKQCKMSCVHE